MAVSTECSPDIISLSKKKKEKKKERERQRKKQKTKLEIWHLLEFDIRNKKSSLRLMRQDSKV
jgi:hypothetical protein